MIAPPRRAGVVLPHSTETLGVLTIEAVKISSFPESQLPVGHEIREVYFYSRLFNRATRLARLRPGQSAWEILAQGNSVPQKGGGRFSTYIMVIRQNNFSRMIINSGWLFMDRAVRLGLGLIISIWLVRYLGSAQFGSYSYAAAFVAIFTPLAGLGLETIVVRELIRQPEKHDEILGTAFVLTLAGGLVAVAGAAGTIGFLRPNDAVSFWLVVIFASALIFQAFDVIGMWFQSQVAARPVVMAANIARVVSALIKIILMVMQAPLMIIAVAVTAEFVLVAIGMIVIYVAKGRRLWGWRINPTLARQLLVASWPLAVSLIASTLYLRLSLLMLGNLVNNEVVGIYAAAVRVSEICYTLPPAVMASAFPFILETRQVSLTRYYQQLQLLFSIMVGLAGFIAIPTTIFADPITAILYGPAYAATAPVLAIHIWTVLFVFVGAAQAAWDAAEGLTGLALARAAVGSLTVAGLGLTLVPKYGAAGMALATVVAYALSIGLVNAAHPRARQVLKLQLRAPLFFGQVWKAIRQRLVILTSDSTSS